MRNMDGQSEQKMNEVLSRAELHSPWLRLMLRRHPDLKDRLMAGQLAKPEDAESVLAAEPDIHRALRIARGRMALSVGIGDLAGLLSLDDVMGQLTDFADWAVDQAVKAAITAHLPGAEARGFAVIALGKQGSRELNYSSDIDPIFLFSPDAIPHHPHEEPAEAAVRIGRRVIDLLQTRDGEGYVLRVDLRLRPNPEITPIVLPIGAAISYYESQALPWERAAFIRARACAGDMELGQSFLDAIQPFVWRRGLDYGAIGEIRSISHRIRDHYESGQNFGPGYDLKRGRGGIRECEFFAQIHQLIHGGREMALRVPATSKALTALASAGRIEAETANALREAYRFYRTVEHRLQMIDDRQTHSLPDQAEALDAVARLHGLRSGQQLLAKLAPHVDRVGALYDALDSEAPRILPVRDDSLTKALGAAGFPDPRQAAKRIAHWRSGRLRAVRSPASLEALEAVLPALVDALGGAPDPTRALNQLSTLIERLPSAVNFFRLLEAQPALLSLLAAILIHAPPLAEALARQPHLLDRLLDASAFDQPGDVATLVTEMLHEGPLEAQFDRVRQYVGEMRFSLGVQLIQGSTDPLSIAAAYATLAEAALLVVTDATRAEFEAVHGKVASSELIILALGRFGGGELTHASDLDLIFLFTGSWETESDGRRPLGAVHYYNRLAQRVIAGLSVPTAAGALYEIDTRLRPSGGKGPLSVSLEGFARYQAKEAWTWEHMALCRARCIYGSPEGRSDANAVIAATLSRPYNCTALLRDARQMRADIAKAKPPAGPLDVKLQEGGLIDLEFAIHVTQLRFGKGLDPRLPTAIQILINQDLAPADLLNDYQLLTRFLVMLRLVAPDLTEPEPATRAIIAQACGQDGWSKLLEALGTVRQSVSHHWADVITKGK